MPAYRITALFRSRLQEVPYREHWNGNQLRCAHVTCDGIRLGVAVVRSDPSGFVQKSVANHPADSQKYVDYIPHREDFERCWSRLSDDHFGAMRDELPGMIDGNATTPKAGCRAPTGLERRGNQFTLTRVGRTKLPRACMPTMVCHSFHYCMKQRWQDFYEHVCNRKILWRQIPWSTGALQFIDFPNLH